MILARVANIVPDESSSRQQLQSTLNQFLELCGKYKQYKWGIGKKSTRATQIFDPKMTLNHP